MVEFQYTSSAKLKQFLEECQELGVPPKVNKKYLQSIKYSSSNDFSIPRLLKFIGLLDSSGVPTQLYKDYKMKSKRAKILGQAIRKAYKVLFEVYPNAHKQSRDKLTAFFSEHTESGKLVVTLTTTTFLTLCELADFDEIENHPVEVQPDPEPQVVEKQEQRIRMKSNPPTININIQFVLPTDKDPKVYDMIFESLKKHLIEWEKDE